MTIYSTLTDISTNPPGSFVVTTPIGAASCILVRLTNQSPFPLYVQGVLDSPGSMPILQPYSQDVYPYTYIRGNISLSSSFTVGSAPNVSYVTAEYTDSAADFKGTYPVSLTVDNPPTADIVYSGSVTNAVSSGPLYVGNLSYLFIQYDDTGTVPAQPLGAFYQSPAGIPALVGSSYAWYPPRGGNLYDIIPVLGPYFVFYLNSTTGAKGNVTISASAGNGRLGLNGTNILASYNSYLAATGVTNIPLFTTFPGTAILTLQFVAPGMSLVLFDTQYFDDGSTYQSVLGGVSTLSGSSYVQGVPVVLSCGAPTIQVNNNYGSATQINFTLASTRGLS